MPAPESPPSDRRRVLGAAGLISALILLSRLLGLVRSGLVARALGHTWLSDTFVIAFEVPNLARRVLGEGSLSSFIVPVFTRQRRQEGEARGWEFANNALGTISVYTALLTLVCWLVAPWIFGLFGGGGFLLKYGRPPFVPEFLDLIFADGARLVRIMIPTLMLLSIAAMMMGLLHTLGSFFTPSLGGVLLNVCMITVCLWCLGWDPRDIVAPLAWSTVAATLLRILVMVPSLIRHGWRPRPRFQPRSEGMRSLYRLMIPALAGMGVVHVNIAVNRTLGALLGEGVITWLNWANLMALFPLALVANALQVAMLPTLTRRLEERNLPALADTISMVLRLVLLVFVPATVGMIVLAYPIMAVVCEGGHYGAWGTLNTAWALKFYALGLVPSALIQMILPLHYARHDTRTPLRAAVIAVAVNLVLNLSLMWTPLAHGGLALSVSLAALVNLALLIRWLRIDLHGVFGPAFWRLAGEVALLSAIMGAACLAAWLAVDDRFLAAGFGPRALMLAALCGGGGLLYAAGAKLLRVSEMEELLRMLRRRRAAGATPPPPGE